MSNGPSERGVIHAPRWANLEKHMRDLAWEMNLQIEVEVEKRFFKKSIRWRVTDRWGESTSKVQNFKKFVNKVVAAVPVLAAMNA